MKAKRKQRLIAIIAIIIGVSCATAFALYAMRGNINLFFTPSEIINGQVPEGQAIRVGGLVVAGSVKRDPESLRVQFTLTDNAHQVVVEYDGILPDLFREGQGIVANGRLTPEGIVAAQQVLAKHDETYMAPEVQESLRRAGHPVKDYSAH
jgi:cytochrome c-type biogenesis protein CcmE